MEKTLRVINQLEKEKVFERYAIGGGTASLFYLEPIMTYDVDIFFIPKEETPLISLSPIYEWLKKKGYSTSKEYVMIEGIPIQFIPAYNELVKEAVLNSKKKKYGNTTTKVIQAEYLLAIMLQTFRVKDKERIIQFLDKKKIDETKLDVILRKHNLSERFIQFKKIL